MMRVINVGTNNPRWSNKWRRAIETTEVSGVSGHVYGRTTDIKFCYLQNSNRRVY